MKRAATLLLASLAATLLTLTVAAAQTPGGVRIGDVTLDAFPDVRVEVVVPGALDGADLTSAFAVTEDGVTREVQRVRQASSADLQVALLIDTSGSMGVEAMADARFAAVGFLDRLPEAARISVISYDTDVEVLTGFDGDRDQHRDAIESLVANGNTSLYDAVMTAITTFPEPGTDTKQSIVVLSDGADTVSVATLDEVTAALEGTGIGFKGIAYKTEEADDASMAAMAEVASGSVAEADDAEALAGIYDTLAAELVNRFLIDYRSDSTGAVELGVELTQGGVTASDVRTIELPTLLPPAESPAPPPPAEAPVTGVTVPIPSVSAQQLLYGGAALWFVALATILALVLRPRERRAQLWGAAHRANAGGGRELAQKATLLAERTLERRGKRSSLNAALERAGIDLRPGEFVVLTSSAVFTAGVVGGLLNGPFAALLLAVMSVISAKLFVSFKTSRRQAKFADQLGDTLQLLAGSLRAGYSFMQAVDAVAREADAPSSEEFSRLVVESRLGRDFGDALHAMAARMESEDFGWVVQAIEIHREVGGDLAEVLDTVAGTIRERNQIRRQVKALSAEGRLSAWVLAALPFGVGTIIFFTNRPYLAELTSGGLLGWGLLATAAILMSVGGLWLRALVKLEF
ncbi:type II secretion system F family protein [Egicoccus sp. AB-alg6-2]|uniref:type II secretion system F family protein n=1 Tax=Egicoccus sp. AB-alg6-2 TaxID=3242692 RepID=UPI00359D864F